MIIRKLNSDSNYTIKDTGITLEISQSKIDSIEKIISKVFNDSHNMNVGIDTRELSKYVGKCTIDLDKFVKSRSSYNPGFYYYLSIADSFDGFNYCKVSNCIRIPSISGGFTHSAISGSSWKINEAYLSGSLWNQHYSRGDSLYVPREQLAKALFIDLSINTELVRLMNVAKEKELKEVTKFLDKNKEMLSLAYNKYRNLFDNYVE